MAEFEDRFTPDGDQVPFPSDNDVLYEKEDDFVWITLNRPLILNAVDWSLRRGLARHLDTAAADDEYEYEYEEESDEGEDDDGYEYEYEYEDE